MCQASQCYKVISSGLDTGGTDLCFRQDTPEPERCQSVSASINQEKLILNCEVRLSWMDGLLMSAQVASLQGISDVEDWDGVPQSVCVWADPTRQFLLLIVTRETLLLFRAGCVGVGRLGMMMRPEWWEWWDVTSITIVITVVSPRVTPRLPCVHTLSCDNNIHVS